MKIWEMREEDIESIIDCVARIWETLREHLPEEFVERNLNCMRRQGVRDAWMKVIEDPNRILLVAEEGGSIAGMAKIAQVHGISSGTVHNHIKKHNKELAEHDECSLCRRVKGEYSHTRATRGTRK